MNVPYDNGTAKLAKGDVYHRFSKQLEDKLIRTGLAEFVPSASDLEALGGIVDAPRPAPSMAMTKAELLAMAEEHGVAVETDDNKAELVRKIEAAG